MGQSNDPKDTKGRSVLLIIITNCKINLYSRFRLELYCKCIEIRHPHARIQEFSSGGGGGPGQSGKKALTAYFTEVKCLFQRKLSFFKVPEGVQNFPGGGVQHFPGGPIAYSL